MRLKVNKLVNRFLENYYSISESFSWKKLFRLPGPKDLGMSESNNVMPSRFFANFKGELSWEDYEDKIKELFPVRFFFAYIFYDFIRYDVWFKISSPIGKLWHYLVSHLIPSRRYHMLDLRQPKSNVFTVDHYRYGWIDVTEKILLANFALLNEFVEKEVPNSYFVPSDEDIKNTSDKYGEKTSLIRQRDIHHEIMEIYNWWNSGRKAEAKEKNKLLTNWSDFRKIDPCSFETEKAWKDMQNAEEAFEAKTEEMLIRLIKIRNYLWT